MGYIGRDNTLSTFTKQSITADGGTSFTLNQGVGDSSSILVSIGGIVQQPDVAYSASGTSLTFTSAPTNAYPIWVIYLGKELTVTNETATDNVDSQAGVGNGTTTPITLVNSVSSAQSIIVTLNGIAQVPGTDFTVSGTTLTFTTAPSAAMAILVYYVALSGTANVPVDYSVSSASQFVSSGTWPAWNGSALTNAGGDATQADIDGLIAALANLSFLQNIDHSTALLNIVEGWGDTFLAATSVAGEDFNVPLTKFSATSAANTGDRLSIADGSLGQTDNLEGTISFWWDLSNSTDTDYIAIFDNTSTGFRIDRSSTNDGTAPGGLSCFARFGSPNATKINARTTSSWTASDGLIHVVCSWKIGGVEADRRFYWVVNGQVQTNDSGSLILASTAPDMTTGTFYLGSNGAGYTGIQGEIGQFYFIQDYIDLSVQANREKFVSGTGASVKPVDFGADGSTPLGAQPLVYLNNPYSTFQNNAGSGGNFTVMAHTGTAELVDGGYVDTSDTNALYSSDSFTNAYELIDSHGKELTASTNALGVGVLNDYVGQSITLSSGVTVTRLSFELIEQSSATGNVRAEIHGVTGTIGTDAVSNGIAIAVSNFVDASTIGLSKTIVNFDFPQAAVLPAGDYWIGLFYKGGDGSNYINLSVEYPTPTHSSSFSRHTNAGAWVSETNRDCIFYLYGTKNIDLITKGTDALTTVDSPASAPTKGHIEALVDDRILSGIIKDSSSHERPVTVYDGAHQDSSIVKTNNSSINFDGTGDYLSVPDSADWNFGSAYTVEMWFRLGSVSGNMAMLEHGTSKSYSGINILIQYKSSGSKLECFMGNNGSTGTSVETTTMGSLAISRWYHLAFVKNGNRLFIAIDGTIINDVTGNMSANNVAATLKIGEDSAFAEFNGNMDNIRISNVARYTANFTPSTTPFTSDSNTLLLVGGNAYTYPTLNTDIIGELSRDGGTTYSPATLARSSTGIDGASSQILSGDVDFTGDPSGTNVVGRIRTVNKDKITVDGISVNWS